VLGGRYKEMPKLDPKVAVHSLSIERGVSPKKHPPRHFHPKLMMDIEKEVTKVMDAKFIHEVKYPT